MTIYMRLSNAWPISNTGEKYDYQYLSNISLRFKIKPDGHNHVREPERLSKALGGQERTDNTIILGANIAHPGTSGASGSPSIASVVTSVDNEFQNYLGSMRLQAGGRERIDGMHSLVYEGLEVWFQKNESRMPEYTLIYRDSISESMFDKCGADEITAIE
ncbi:hypothetical protein K469DRAFT_691697 [Zopfia rhizophila CBS 207.26]|uniref:Piwi domain-containing protein n=1 Tax=Zopfia rhizophila CBS 207.26 TaxID=1314779 RepID=A0A6A6DV96_9PEZI|nr:hypothetical protein K469DRAFT_691697 [Zopfia rhizophila CBS 207.26]